MAQLFIDSFDHYVTADVTTKWSTTNTGATIVSGGRNGNCLQAGFNSVTAKSIPTTVTGIVGFALKLANTPSTTSTIVEFVDSTSIQVDIRMLNTGQLIVTRNGTTLGTTVASVPIGVFFHLAFKATINNTTGAYEVRVNDINVLSATGVNTRTSANNSFTSLRIGHSQNVGMNASYDDLYFFDAIGSTNNDFIGDVAIGCSFPNAAGDLTDWTPSTGSNYQCVDEAASNGDTDYVASSTVGNKDLYNFGNISGAAISIYGVQRTLMVRKDDAGARTVKPIYKGGGTVYEGSAVSVSNGYTYVTDILETDPDTGIAWTTAGVNAAQFGVKLES